MCSGVTPSLPAGWAAVLLQTSRVSFLHQAQQCLGPNGLPCSFFFFSLPPFGNTPRCANVCIWQSVRQPRQSTLERLETRPARHGGTAAAGERAPGHTWRPESMRRTRRS